MCNSLNGVDTYLFQPNAIKLDMTHKNISLSPLVIIKIVQYSYHTIKKAMHLSLNKNNNDIKDQNLSTPKVSLPYIKGATDKITKILNKHSINVAFTPANTIRQLFNSVKDPINPNLQKGVYVIPCSCGKEYIGETGRSLNIRIK